MAYSADRKPGELTALTTLATDDVFVVGDTSDASEVAKGITKANLITDLGSSFAPALGADDNYVTDAEKAALHAAVTVTDGTTVNFTLTGQDLTAEVIDGTITLAKQANVDTATVFYRKTAGAGAPEVQTLTTLKTDLGLSNTNSGDQTTIVGITGTKAQFDTAVTDGNFLYVGDVVSNATHTGEVTGSTALTIADDAVTYAKMQNVVANNVILGNNSGAGGIVDELTATEVRTLINVEDGADVTDATNVTAAGALMDSELADITFIKVLSDATASDVNTGTDANKVVTADALAGSNLGIRYFPIALNGSTALTTSDKYYFRVPAALTGMNLVSVSATVGTGAAGSSSSGTPTFTVKNVTDAQQMLSTSLTVDASEYTSATAATAAVINGTYDDVVTDDLIEVACTTAGTGVTYATITLGFQLP